MTNIRFHLIAAAAVLCATAAAAAQAPVKLKVGLMLPYTGTYASLGTAIENGFRQYMAEQGNKLMAATSSLSRSMTSPTRPRIPTTSTS